MGQKVLENLRNKVGAYTVLRQIRISDGGSYPAQIEVQTDVDKESAIDILEKLSKVNLVYEISGTDPQRYDLNYSHFSDCWKSLWEEEIEDIPVTPVNFSVFIENYVKSYLQEVEKSSLDEMLVTEFYFALIHTKGKKLPESFEELSKKLENQFGGKNNAKEFVNAGLTKVD